MHQRAISDNPFVPHPANVLKIRNMFWTKDVDAITIVLSSQKQEGVRTYGYLLISKNVVMADRHGICITSYMDFPRALQAHGCLSHQVSPRMKGSINFYVARKSVTLYVKRYGKQSGVVELLGQS